MHVCFLTTHTCLFCILSHLDRFRSVPHIWSLFTCVCFF